MHNPEQFTRIIRWSEEDGLYIGSLPEIAPDCCHGHSVQEVYALLDQLAEDSLADCLEHGIEFDAPGSATIIVTSPAPNQDTAKLTADLRRSLSLNQADFATALGVSKSTLSKWETGERRPDAAAAKLLRILSNRPELLNA